MSRISSWFIYSFIVWITGFVILGGPIWALLHFFNKRLFWHALLAGYLVTFLVVFGILTKGFTGKTGSKWSSSTNGVQNWDNGVMTAAGWAGAFTTSMFFGVIGMAMGALIWFVVYKRP